MNLKKEIQHEELDHYIAKCIKIRNAWYDYVRILQRLDNDKFDGKIPEPPALHIPKIGGR